MVKLVGYAFLVLIILAILKEILPYIVLFLALCGVLHIYEMHKKR